MKRLLCGFIAGLAFFIAGAASARVVTVAPEVTALLPAEGVATQAVMKFDVASLGLAGSRIQHAFLEWTVEGVDAEEVPEFVVQDVTAGWEASAVASGEAEVAAGEGYVATWEITAQDHERNGGFVRLDVTVLVRGWVTQTRDNHGVLLGVMGVDRRTLSGQTGGVRLVIRYGFRSN